MRVYTWGVFCRCNHPDMRSTGDTCKMQAKTCLEVSTKRTVLHSALHIPQTDGGNRRGRGEWSRENTPRRVVSKMRLQLRDKTSQVRQGGGEVFLRKTGKRKWRRAEAFSVRDRAAKPRLPKLNGISHGGKKEKEERRRRTRGERG